MEGMAEAAELDQSFHEYENDAIPEQEQEHEGKPVPAVARGGERWPGWPGESVFRIVVPSQKVGCIIGRKGESIKRICEETKARIKIFDGPPRAAERAVMVSSKEVPDASHPPAINGLLEVHKRIVGLESDSLPPSSAGTKVSTKLLVPASQAGNLIGKQGSTVKSIQEASKCIVRVLGTEDIPIFALQDDRVVELVGEPAAVHNAVELVASQLRKFLVDRSIIPIIESQMQTLCSQIERMPPPPQLWGPPPQAFPPSNAGGPRYGADPHFMPPPRQHDNYYPPPAEMPLPMQHEAYYPQAEMPPPIEKQRHQGISAYGREPPMVAVNASSNQPAPTIIAQVKQHIQIPLSYADAVIGNNGANISYIRRTSGATVTIQESRGAPGEMTIEINGTSSQVQTAQQLIQNFMAEAASASQAHAGAPTDQGYNPYAAQGTAYSAPPTQTDLSGQTGGYGSVYGTSYGY